MTDEGKVGAAQRLQEMGVEDAGSFFPFCDKNISKDALYRRGGTGRRVVLDAVIVGSFLTFALKAFKGMVCPQVP